MSNIESWTDKIDWIAFFELNSTWFFLWIIVCRNRKNEIYCEILSLLFYASPKSFLSNFKNNNILIIMNLGIAPKATHPSSLVLRWILLRHKTPIILHHLAVIGILRIFNFQLTTPEFLIWNRRDLQCVMCTLKFWPRIPDPVVIEALWESNKQNSNRFRLAGFRITNKNLWLQRIA